MPEYLQFFENNEKAMAEAQPEVYAFATKLAETLQPLQANYSVPMALLVNSIVDFSSFCTSVVVRNETSYTHVRNLDFDFPDKM